MALTPTTEAVPVLNPDNGHYYDVVFEASITWTQARQQAELLFHDSTQGHLVTITSLAENLWLFTTFGADLNDKWIGAWQPDKNNEPSGGFEWITGEAFGFTNWSGAQPDNLGGFEDFVSFTRTEHSNANGMTWNDAPDEPNFPGFVVEFDTPSNSSDPIPEPGTLILFGIAVFGIVARGLRRRIPNS